MLVAVESLKVAAESAGWWRLRISISQSLIIVCIDACAMISKLVIEDDSTEKAISVPSSLMARLSIVG